MFKFKLILDNLKGTSKQLSCPRIYIKKEPTEAKLKFQGSLLRPFLWQSNFFMSQASLAFRMNGSLFMTHVEISLTAKTKKTAKGVHPATFLTFTC